MEGQTSALIMDNWNHIALSFDGNASNKHLYVNGVEENSNFTTLTTDTIAYSDVDQIALMSNTFGFLAGELSDFWFDTIYIDLSTNNPFYDTETNKPKFLGIDGSLPTGSPPLVYLPMRGNDAGNNAGTGGDFTVNSGPYTGARGPAEYWASAAEFNGSSQKLQVLSALTGAVDSKLFSMAVSYRTDIATTGSRMIFSCYDGTAPILQIYSNGSDPYYLSVLARNLANEQLMAFNIPGSWAPNTWFNLLISWDLNNTSLTRLYLNGVAPSLTIDASKNEAITFGSGVDGNFIGGQLSGSFMDGRIGFFSMWQEYIDWSQEAMRLLVFDAFGYPVDIGEQGELVTGTPPLIYMNTDFHLGTNLGTGGDFTPQNTPTDGGFVRG